MRNEICPQDSCKLTELQYAIEDARAENARLTAELERAREAIAAFDKFTIFSTFDAKGTYTHQKSIELAAIKAEAARLAPPTPPICAGGIEPTDTWHPKQEPR